MKRTIALGTLSREARSRGRTSARSEAATRAVETRAKPKPPSKWRTSWQRTDPSDWNARDLLGYYLAAHLRDVGREDCEVVSESDRVRASTQLRRILDALEPGESPKDFVDYAIAECQHGKGFPQDRTVSIGAITARSLLLKRWRSSARTLAQPPATRREWAEAL